VPLESPEKGQEQAREFIIVARGLLRPEDSDVQIIYSTETDTPIGWQELEPNRIRRYHDSALPKLCTRDIEWKCSIEKLTFVVKLSPLRLSVHRPGLTIEFEEESSGGTQLVNTPFPSEVGYLLRAAFKDKARIKVGMPRQGFSGSMGYIIYPFDQADRPTKRFFAKVYPEQTKANEEYKNFRDHVFEYFPNINHPSYDFERRYVGVAYSLIVTDLVEYAEGQSLAFLDMVQSPDFSAEQAIRFMSVALNVMDHHWPSYCKDTPIDLVGIYLGDVLKDEKRKQRLESENSCHKWFNKWFSCSGGTERIEENIQSYFCEGSLVGRKLKKCHGDLHGENLMVGHRDRHIPVFIDFSRTGETHYLKDLVTVESDLIIRGLNGIPEYLARDRVMSFLESLGFGSEGATNRAGGNAERESLQAQKVKGVIGVLRRNAVATHGASESEYQMAALLKTLEVLSYGKLPHQQNERAVQYVTHLCNCVRLTPAARPPQDAAQGGAV